MNLSKTLFSSALKNYHQHGNPISFSLLLFSSSTGGEQQQPNPPVANYLVKTHDFSPETASKVSSALRSVKNTEKFDSVLSFLKQSGFSKTHVEQVVKMVPTVLTADLDSTIKPKIKIFKESGFSSTATAQIISTHPWILTDRSPNRLGQTLLLLEQVLGSPSEVYSLLKKSGWFFDKDLELTVIPNIEFLKKECGICSDQITRYMHSYPRFLVYKPEKVKEFVRRVDEMGFDRGSRMFILAIRTVSSMTLEHWERKLEVFRGLGFTEKDILLLFRRMPKVFTVSETKIREGTQVLLSSSKKFDLSTIVKYPMLLMFNIEGRLKPRSRVLEILERENVLLVKPGLAVPYYMTDKEFLKKYVLPYSGKISELPDIVKGTQRK